MLKLAVLFAILSVALAIRPRYDVSVNSNQLKIIGGQTTDISLYPWQISLQYRNQHFCGGFLISSRWVVTAAHCIVEGYSTNLNIRAGSSRVDSGGVSVAVSKYIVHENFNDITADFDIALLYLASGVQGNNIRAATLPTAYQAIADNVQINVTGWGVTSENGYVAKVLQVVSVPTVNPQTCRAAYGLIDPVADNITDNMFCAGLLDTGGKDSCQGDSGGPASRNGQVIGIVSWGIGCAIADFPGVYTHLSKFRNWITQNANV